MSDLTCLVGKNESGKTTILRGLYRLNPSNPSEANFVPLDDYPRRRYAEYKTRHDKTPDPILTTKWQLEDKDMEDLAKKLGPTTLKSRTIGLTKGYDNRIRANAEADEAAFVSYLVGAANLKPEEANRVAGVATISETASRLTGQPQLTPAQSQLATTLQTLSPDGQLSTAIGNVVVPFLPKFLYFADYEKMSGQVALDDFINKKKAGQLAGGQRIFSALLELAGASAEELKAAGKFEALKAELEAVSNRITGEIFDYWTQNEDLEVEFDFGPGMPQDQPPFNSGWIFRTRVYNKLHQASVNFDERSTGFIWFFSFLVWFSQLKKTYGENLIVLLDEPGLSLHGRAQEDLLRFIKEQLQPRHQVVYTTHSPFMVDPDNLLGVRTVEDRSTKKNIIGTKVSDKVLRSDRDTIFPLQAALGYDIAQSLFVGKHTLLVEGPSDLVYLRWASNELRSRKRAGLDERWVIAPAGGIDKFWSFVALFGGNKLDLAIVSDFHQGDKNRLRSLRESKIVPSERVLTADTYTGQAEADVEDILGPEFYLSLVDACYGLKGSGGFRAQYTQPGRRVVETVGAHVEKLNQGGQEVKFDHLAVAVYLVEHASAARTFAGIDVALDRMEAMFKDLNGFL